MTDEDGMSWSGSESDYIAAHDDNGIVVDEVRPSTINIQTEGSDYISV